MLLGTKPFVRICEPAKKKHYLAFLERITPIYHQANFVNFYIRNLYPHVGTDEMEFLELYLFKLLRDWVDKNEKYDAQYVANYEKLIRFLEIEPRFSFLEHAYLEEINSIVFALNRKLKSMMPQFKLFKKEIGYYFSEDSVIAIGQPNDKPLICKGNLLITNKRMMFIAENICFCFRLDDLTAKKVNSHDVDFHFRHTGFKIQTNTPEFLNIYINKIIRKEKHFNERKFINAGIKNYSQKIRLLFVKK